MGIRGHSLTCESGEEPLCDRRKVFINVFTSTNCIAFLLVMCVIAEISASNEIVTAMSCHINVCVTVCADTVWIRPNTSCSDEDSGQGLHS